MMSVINKPISLFAESGSADCHSAVCRYAECHSAECRYAERR
jgi:hypothetical protein